MNADLLAAATADVLRHLNTAIPGSRLLRKDGAVAWITGIPRPSSNIVWLERPNPAISAVVALLDEVAAADVPFSMLLRPGSDAALTDLAAARGMKPAGERPCMVLDATAWDGGTGGAPGLAIRRLGPDEAQVHVRLSAAAAGVPEEPSLPFADLLRLDGLRCYVGEVDGRPVATAFGVTLGEFTAIFNVATDAAFRRRGFGTALSARAVTDGILAGSSWCWLQASEDGYPVYRNLGFQTIETWPVWVSGV